MPYTTILTQDEKSTQQNAIAGSIPEMVLWAYTSNGNAQLFWYFRIAAQYEYLQHLYGVSTYKDASNRAKKFLNSYRRNEQRSLGEHTFASYMCYRLKMLKHTLSFINDPDILLLSDSKAFENDLSGCSHIRKELKALMKKEGIDIESKIKTYNEYRRKKFEAELGMTCNQTVDEDAKSSGTSTSPDIPSSPDIPTLPLSRSTSAPLPLLSTPPVATLRMS